MELDYVVLLPYNLIATILTMHYCQGIDANLLNSQGSPSVAFSSR